jgi:predicted small lipoprotein YifL
LISRTTRPSLVALMASGTLAGCGSSGPSVELEDGTKATGGKALVLKASTDARLSSSGGGYFAVELRGIDVRHGERATYERPDYRN